MNERWVDQDNQPQERTTWFRVTAWRKLAEVCNQYLSKGRQVLVEGRVSASAWQNQAGEPQATLELTARTVKFLGRREAIETEGVEEAEEEIPPF